MKPFLVFMAVLMVFIMCFTYTCDNERYMGEMGVLKATAEECAATAALEIDEEAYGLGKIEFDEEAATRAAREHFDYYLDHIGKLKVKSSKMEISFGPASVTVTLYLETEDIFHLPFIAVTKLCRMSTYEYV